MKLGVMGLLVLILLIGTVSAELEIFGDDNEEILDIGEGIAAAITSFLSLTDTPSSYSGQGGNCVAVTAGEDGLEFVTCGGVGGGSGASKWVDVGSFIIPNTTFADNIRVATIEATDWSNVTITESQISDLTHTVDTQKDTSGDYVYNDSTTIYSNDTKLKDHFNQTQIILDSNATWNNNTLYYADEDWINKNSSNAFVFNESKLATIYYNVTQALAIAGTVDGGTLVDTQHPEGDYDSVTFNFSEVAGSPGLDMRMNFTNVSAFNNGLIRYKTSDLKGDFPIIQVWSYDDSKWEDYPTLAKSESFVVITQPVYDNLEHVQNGVVQMRLYKASNGNTGNHYYVDWVAVTYGYGTPAGEEIDPLSIHRDGSINWIGNENGTGYNSTFDNFFGFLNWSWIQNAPSFLLEDTQKDTSGDYVYNDSTTIYSNDTKLIAHFNQTPLILESNNSWTSTFNSTYDNHVEDNATWNASLVPYFNVNSSDHWDNLDSINTTQMENREGVLNILESWLTTFMNTWLAGKTTDDLTEGATNTYSLWENGGTANLKAGVDIDMQSKKIIGLADPTDDQHAATKKYVDDNDVDLTNVAFTNETNVFTPIQNFSGNISAEDSICFNSDCTSYIHWNGTALIGVG